MNLYSRLLHVLNTELGAQEKLLELLGRERAAIVGLDQSALEKFSQEKQALLEQASTREAARSEIVSGIAKECRCEEINLSEILENCPNPDLKRQLESIGKELKSTAEAVRQMNGHNSDLVKYSLGFISSTLSIMHSAPANGPTTYGQSGKTSDSKKKPAGSGRLRTSV